MRLLKASLPQICIHVKVILKRIAKFSNYISPSINRSRKVELKFKTYRYKDFKCMYVYMSHVTQLSTEWQKYYITLTT